MLWLSDSLTASSIPSTPFMLPYTVLPIRYTVFKCTNDVFLSHEITGQYRRTLVYWAGYATEGVYGENPLWSICFSGSQGCLKITLMYGVHLLFGGSHRYLSDISLYSSGFIRRKAMVSSSKGEEGHNGT